MMIDDRNKMKEARWGDPVGILATSREEEVHSGLSGLQQLEQEGREYYGR